MNAPGVDPQDVEAEALWLLEQLASRYGVAWVAGIVAVLVDGPAAGAIVEPVSEWVADIVRSLIDRLTADVVREKLAAAYTAAKAVGDAAIDAKFGKP